MKMTAEEFARIGVKETPTRDGVFELRSPLLKQGITTDTRARTEHLEICVKVYADGGENEMHVHAADDHAFIVLSGQAVFHVGSDDNVKVLDQYQGIMLPQNTAYWFQSAKPNLVMLKVTAPIKGVPVPKMKNLSFIPGWIPLEGKFFPDDVK